MNSSFTSTDNSFQGIDNYDYIFNELETAQQQPQQPPQPLSLCEENEENRKKILEEMRELNQRYMRMNSSSSSSRRNNSKKLSREIVSQHFHLPIIQAAKALKIGVSLLKKRCRELGISRWPSRKLMSIQNLIKTIQEFGEESAEDASILKDAVELLEREKKFLEEFPNAEIQINTKKLRQACFKIKYRKNNLWCDLNNPDDLEMLYREFYQCLYNRCS